jgi:hypothetical protein
VRGDHLAVGDREVPTASSMIRRTIRQHLSSLMPGESAMSRNPSWSGIMPVSLFIR